MSGNTMKFENAGNAGRTYSRMEISLLDPHDPVLMVQVYGIESADWASVVLNVEQLDALHRELGEFLDKHGPKKSDPLWSGSFNR